MQAHHDMQAIRAGVLSGQNSYWEAGPRSAAELKESGTHYERTVALESAPAMKSERIILPVGGDGRGRERDATTSSAEGGGDGTLASGLAFLSGRA